MSIGMPKYCDTAVYKNVEYLPCTGDGAESVENLYLQQVKQFSKNSPTTCLCHDVKLQLIAGNGFNCCGNIIELSEFQKIVKDFIMFNGFSMSVIKDAENNIIKILHEPFEFVRFYYERYDSEPTFISNNNWDKKLSDADEIVKIFTVNDLFYYNSSDDKILYPNINIFIFDQMYFDSISDYVVLSDVEKIEAILKGCKYKIIRDNFPIMVLDLTSETSVRSSVKSFDNNIHYIKRKFEQLFNNILCDDLELLDKELVILELDFEKKVSILKNFKTNLANNKLN
jgi:hypothetical protein